MKKSYTKHQIVEAIKHWEFILKRMDESKSPLLDAFIEKFGEDVVINRKPYILSNDSAIEIAKILNNFLFESKIVNFPEIQILTYGQYCKVHKYREMNFCKVS